jgi:hypothetical protein
MQGHHIPPCAIPCEPAARHCPRLCAAGHTAIRATVCAGGGRFCRRSGRLSSLHCGIGLHRRTLQKCRRHQTAALRGGQHRCSKQQYWGMMPFVIFKKKTAIRTGSWPARLKCSRNVRPVVSYMWRQCWPTTSAVFNNHLNHVGAHDTALTCCDLNAFMWSS